ncbi:MAG: hypothetical protein AAFR73_12070 [Pseudomonadota bacterium]
MSDADPKPAPEQTPLIEFLDAAWGVIAASDPLDPQKRRTPLLAS